MSETARIVAEIGLQDGFSWEDLVAFCAGALTVLTFITLLLRPAARESKEFFVWWRKFQRDWDGEPEQPGRAKVPGVMERLNNMDGELQRNGGKSLKDEIVKIRESVADLGQRVGHIEHRQCEIQQDIAEIKGLKDR